MERIIPINKYHRDRGLSSAELEEILEEISLK